MVEDRSYLLSRVFSASRPSETRWDHHMHPPQEDSSSVSNLTNGKRALADDDAELKDGLRQRKSLKLTDDDSLINDIIGRDISISCLIRCSRSDYASIASLNRSFRSLVKSGTIYRLRRQNRIIEHWVYFSCQLLEWVAFDPVERRWMNLPKMHSAEAPPLVAVVNNELYAADHAGMVVRKYDKVSKKWFTLGRLPERAGSVNGWGLAFRACGERLIVIGGPRSSGGGFIELNCWIPSRDGSSPVWTLLDRKHSSNFVYNCAVMGC
ncbi:unnamed protein product [Eruca vesicaria subsp. sativa]|uniref:Uncharacterized protein n=1 Tax=Eruca vesicaria subsp. sativa TaxID=29727 RepID=A0ABC8LFL6_ERUVS|nr:unnamed protein product [Eruca vesicaria subsp. sativa]